MSKKFFTIIVIMIGLISNPIFVISQTSNSSEIEVLNQEIAARKDKIKQLEETINVYKKNIEQKRLESVSLKNQLSILDNRLSQSKTDLQMTEEKISETELEMEVLSLAIADKQLTMMRQKKIISQIVNGIQRADQKNYLEIILTNDDFANFFNEVKNLENIYTDLGRSVKNLRLAKEDLDDKQKLVEEQKNKYQKLKDELVNKKADLADQLNVKQNLLAQTQSSEKKYQTLLDSLRKQYQVIEGEISSYEAQVRKKLESQNKISESSAQTMVWPVPSRYITASFHDPEYPYRKVMEHSGADIRAAQGTAIRAAASGYVARAKRCSAASCYSYVLLVHNGNLSTVYGHMSAIGVSEDQYVNQGDIIGRSGGTPGTAGAGPFVTGAHLHFEVRANGIPVDPMGYLIQ